MWRTGPTAHYVTRSVTKTAAGIFGRRRADAARRDQGCAHQLSVHAVDRRAGAKLVGQRQLKRLDFGAGQGDWKSTEWVADAVKDQLLAGAGAQPPATALCLCSRR
jgi:hypothetical protein